MQTSKKYISFTHTLQSIYIFGGFERFWKGSLLIGSASIPAHALYFSVYEYGKKTYGVEKSVTCVLTTGIPNNGFRFNRSYCYFFP
jgi:hypothetical protein